jgi:hypothetical protein
MKVEKSYFIKTINDVLVWLAVGAEIPAGAIVIEERPMLIPEEGMVLRNKQTGAISSGHWLRNGDNADNWEEIEEPKEVEDANE